MFEVNGSEISKAIEDISYENVITSIIKESYSLKEKILLDHKLIYSLSELSKKLVQVIKNGNKIFFAGNGGSASDSQHLAAEFVCRLEKDRDPLPAMALSTDTSIMTAVSNDYKFEDIFSRQIAALGSRGDIFIGITTSGNSKNILKTFETCFSKNIHTACFCGENGISESYNIDYTIKVPSFSTQRIQEVHILLGHIMCGIVESKIFPE